MGTDIYKANYKFIFGHISEDELEFIEQYLDESDDNSFYVEELALVEAIKTAELDGVKIPTELIKALRKQIAKEKFGGFSFRLF